MIELAISYLHPMAEDHHGVNETLYELERNTSALQKEVLSRIHHTEESMVLEEQMRLKLKNTSTRYFSYALWEIVCVFGLMFGQMFVLKKLVQRGMGSIV